MLKHPALLALADGTVFRGRSIGADGESVGELVFNTAMTGYQEILTDPSYARQIVTLTSPHIGNVGVNEHDEESARVHASGLVIRDLSLTTSNWRAQQPLAEYLRRRGVVAIAGIDTRKVTRVLRERGAQHACLRAGEDLDAEAAVEAARRFPGLTGMDLAEVVSTGEPYTWEQGSWQMSPRDGSGKQGADPGVRTGTGADGGQTAQRPRPVSRRHVVAYDYGVKRNILRHLVDRGCRVTVVPARTSAQKALELRPDGIFLSNGPGDPQPCDYAIEAIRAFLETGIPLFGICLGHQLLGLAVGARTMKMKFGHHGANHPVVELASGRVLISSQNHGFALDHASLPPAAEPTHRSLFDGSLQGIRIRGVAAFGFQGHPEASPGPHDVVHLFDRFVELMA